MRPPMLDSPKGIPLKSRRRRRHRAITLRDASVNSESALVLAGQTRGRVVIDVNRWPAVTFARRTPPRLNERTRHPLRQ